MNKYDADKKYFYVTTPIYYVNDKPHLGHAYSTVIADAIARFKRLSGYTVFFMTGTDEHGLKIEKEAAARNLTPKALADGVHVKFRELFEKLGVNYDRFIRTTDADHAETVKDAFLRLKEKGDVYLSEYEGWYCIPDETFLTEKSLVSGNCPQCGRAAVKVKEESYFLRLSEYQDRLLKYIEENPDFIKPGFRKNEVVSFVKEGLNDLSVSRTSFKWGIPVPGDEKHVVYVWFDALLNYLTGIGYLGHMKRLGTDSSSPVPDDFTSFFESANHIVGKDILKFHAVYWPIMLMALGLPMPKTVFAHGWWLMDNKKMSKSIGNVVDPLDLISEFGADALRFYLLREVPPGLDGDFNFDNFITRYNSELANDLGNLVSRATAMLKKFNDGVIPGNGGPDAEDNLFKDYDISEGADGNTHMKKGVGPLIKGLNKRYDNYEFSKILEDIFQFINTVNKYINDNTPWKLNTGMEEDTRKLNGIMRNTFRAILYISYLIYPFMPYTSDKVNGILNIPSFSQKEEISSLWENTLGAGWVNPSDGRIKYVASEWPGVLPEHDSSFFPSGHEINQPNEVLFPKK